MKRTFEQTLEYMFAKLPMFQRLGSKAFKKDLSNTIAFCKELGNPHDSFKTIHVAGTNGKGSSSHMIAAILQDAGYKVGLYTSPHLKSFTERIKINGNEIEKERVIDFVAQNESIIEKISPSFFELTVCMAYKYFADEKVDIAVIETGLGGRLDSTNIITPLVSLITNIGLDHTDMLGDTLDKIAFEKGGIIKSEIPVVIGTTQEETTPVFDKIASERSSEIIYADQIYKIENLNGGTSIYKNGDVYIENVNLDLKGNYQLLNLKGVLSTIDAITSTYNIAPENIINGLEKTTTLTNLKGRWQVLQASPKMICDTGHNEDGLKLIVSQLENEDYQKLHIVLGVVQEKDLKKILSLLPKSALYYYCKPNVPRGLTSEILKAAADQVGLNGIDYSEVNKAIQAAKSNADKDDLIFIGGSTFVVAEIENL
ncbi:bifunctional folylpolyglutamate synthase/dihydrofolate synthase [Sediminitomix flava]|uniref:Dihydrofolate synthase/folylpolyglutamate synthase n=1 Tax=Sediminitomix flava TaxID=379075 RepID=A0A315Z9Z9_SEDFL|nr:folylpolyglutamate synthase/dihydrofolate synthase family protein [Sediminitomix flava]PWJ42405.1 dihydrofolate synthase/folylpolyglutamate synthase [Sediminitomix flava]